MPSKRITRKLRPKRATKSAATSAASGTAKSDKAQNAAALAARKQMRRRARTQQRAAETEFIIETLVASRTREDPKLGTIKEYKVKWVGYPLSECTWEPEANLPYDYCEQFDLYSEVTTPVRAGKPLPLSTGCIAFRCGNPACFRIEGHPMQFLACGDCVKKHRDSAIRYCSEACQKAHWREHKKRHPSLQSTKQKKGH
eukprot:m.50042 g.50042  ORF g.50042 m.50042 type:complete len:199 (-) comp6511_c0_seq1:251-847(-)